MYKCGAGHINLEVHYLKKKKKNHLDKPVTYLAFFLAKAPPSHFAILLYKHN